MWTDNKKAISEVNQILHQLSDVSLNKIPKILLDELKKNATVNVDYIKPNIPLEDLTLEEETKEILAVISYNYFCNNVEKEAWNKELEENEKKYQNELRKKYNIDNLFKNTSIKDNKKLNNTEILEETSLTKYKDSFFRKICNKFKTLFRK